MSARVLRRFRARVAGWAAKVLAAHRAKADRPEHVHEQLGVVLAHPNGNHARLATHDTAEDTPFPGAA